MTKSRNARVPVGFLDTVHDYRHDLAKLFYIPPEKITSPEIFRLFEKELKRDREKYMKKFFEEMKKGW